MPGRSLARGRKGYVATPKNLARALTTAGWWRAVGYDTFRDELVWCAWSGGGRGQWAPWTDEDYTRAQIALEVDGFEPPSFENVRRGVQLAAREKVFDSAQLWLKGLVWDGVDRVDGFMESVVGAPGEYAAAVGAYLWTAMAGRVLEPGVQADMAPILVGEGGAGKTSLVKALAPAVEFSARISLQMSEDTLARMLRGRLVVEIAELRGLHTKDSESIKDFVTGTHDIWVPKYREFASRSARRFVMIGTTDKEEFLADDAGNNRRWLPVRVGAINLEALTRDRDQLWAEGAARFAGGGVEWQRAEALAGFEHAQYAIEDTWSEVIEAWSAEAFEGELSTGGEAGDKTWRACGFTVREALVFGAGLSTTSLTKSAEMRCANILRALGFRKSRNVMRGKSKLTLWRRHILPPATT